jgi:hypothetical protein
MLSKSLLIAVFILSSNLLIFAQAVSLSAGEQKTPDNKEKTIALLKTVGREAGSLNMPENRVRYLTEAANLLWQHDEKTARVFYANAQDGFRAIMESLDAAYQKRTMEEPDDSFSFFGRGTDRSNFYQANTFRRNLLLSLAKHDPQAAHDFFRETGRENFKEFGWGEGDLQAQIVALMAKNDPVRALALGQETLKKNEFEGLGAFALDLYRKDAEKGAKFAAEMVVKISDFRAAENSAAMLSAALQLFNEGADQQEKSDAAKTPLLSKSDLSELAQTLIRAMSLKNSGNSYLWYNNSETTRTYLKKYAPAAYAALEREVQQAAARNAVESDEGDMVAVENPPATAVKAGTGVGSSLKNTGAPQVETLPEPAAKEPDEVPVEEIRKKLGEIRGRNQRLLAAVQIIKTLSDKGQKDKAKLLLPEINALQVVQPRKGVEMLQNLMFADTVAGIEPERAFVALESTIYGFNEVAASIMRIGEFLDAREMTGDGEFNMAGFTKEFFRTDSSGGAGDFTRMFMHLATADFDRTTALADKFDRPELRLEARMMIVRSILPPENR